MSHQITTAFVQQYKSNVMLEIQQRNSRFATLVRRESQQAEYDYYESIGPVSAEPWGPRHGDTPLMETPHDRRRCSISPWIFADLIDKPDKVRTLIEPTSPYVTNAVSAFNRRKDDIIIQAALGTAYTGYEGEVPVALPASNILDMSTGRMTLQALREVKLGFWNDDVDEGQTIVMACTPDQISSLLEDPEVTSADFNTVRALVNGDISSFYGINFVRSTRLPLEANGDGTYTASAIAWVPEGILLATAEDIFVDIGPRRDKKMSVQVFVSMDIGAVRMDEKLVRVVKTKDETKSHPAP